MRAGPRESTFKPISPASVIVAVLFALMWIGMGSLTLERAKRQDFLNLYVGGQIAADGEFARLHDQDLQLEYERRIQPDTEMLWPFVRPHFYAGLLAPMSRLPFDKAFVAWIVLHSALLLGCWVWAARRFGEDALILGSMYLPTSIGIANGQDCIFLLVAVVIAYRLAEKQRDALAGAVVALTLAKFHLLLLLPAAMWLAGRRRMVAGYAAGASALVGFSLATGGLEGAALYVRMLTDSSLAGLNPGAEKIISIQTLQWNLFGTTYPPLTLALAAVVAAIAWRAVRNAPLWRWWTAGCLASLLAVPHVYAYDAGFLLLGIWLSGANSKARMTRAMAGIVAAPLVFFLSFMPSEHAPMYAPAVALLLWLVGLAREAGQTQTSPIPNEPRPAAQPSQQTA